MASTNAEVIITDGAVEIVRGDVFNEIDRMEDSMLAEQVSILRVTHDTENTEFSINI